MSTKDERVELLHGTLDLLILRTLLFGPVHGHAIAKATKWEKLARAIGRILKSAGQEGRP